MVIPYDNGLTKSENMRTLTDEGSNREPHAMKICYYVANKSSRRLRGRPRDNGNDRGWTLYYSESGVTTTLSQKPDHKNSQGPNLQNNPPCLTEARKDCAATDFNHQSVDNGNAKDHDGDFYAFFREFLAMKQARISAATLELYYVELSKIMRFREKLTFSQITLDLIIQYENYMLTQLKNRRNTVSKSLRKVKTVIRFAVLKGLMARDPFAGYRLMNERSNRQFLSENELKSMEKLLHSNLTNLEKDILRGFLFSCYTGLRYQDIIRLQSSDIREKMIELQLHKTREVVSIPIIDKAFALLSGLRAGLFFPILRNDIANRHLRFLCLKAGIKKHVTFHVARHTFATLSLNKGIPIEIVSSLLGHNNIQTTQVYTRIMDSTKKKMMERWNQ